MADFGGFIIDTPQEILARERAQRQAVILQGNQMQRREARIQDAMAALFGSPEARRAEQLIQRIKTAEQSIERGDNEGDFDYEIRRLKVMRDGIADLSPETAAQINTRLLQLGESKFQRERLIAGDRRAEAQEARAARKFEFEEAELQQEAAVRNLTGGNTYILNTRNGEAKSYDLLNSEDSAKFAKESRMPNTIVISSSQAFDLYKSREENAAALRRALAKADNDSGSKVTLQQVERTSAGLLDVYANADRILQVLEANPDVLTEGSKGARQLDRVAVEIGAAGRAASGGVTKEGTNIDTWLKANSVTNTRMQGLVVGLAYSLAKTNDPGGRLSDKDLAAAIEMVGGTNPNPNAIIANLNDNLTARSQAMLDRLDTADPDTQEKMAKRISRLRDRSDSFNRRIQQYAGGKRGRESTGITNEQGLTEEEAALIRRIQGK